MSLKPASRVIAIGAIHQDTIAHAAVPIDRETSTPSRFASKPGGVATNVARALARLGTPTTLIGTVGDDTAAQALRERLARDGLELVLIERPGYASGQYLALHDPDGSLAAACVDDRVLTDAPPDLFDKAVETAAVPEDQDRIWFLDANLPGEMLHHVTRRIRPEFLIANAVSDAKAPRLRAILSELDCLTLNKSEAAAITGEPQSAPLERLAEVLSATGVKSFVLTNGKDDMLIHSGQGLERLSPRRIDIVDVTGAGDALTAGLIAALARGHAFKDAARYGQTAAALTLTGTGALAEGLSWDTLENF